MKRHPHEAHSLTKPAALGPRIVWRAERTPRRTVWVSSRACERTVWLPEIKKGF